MSRPMQSILRAASTGCTGSNCSHQISTGKRVTFAESVAFADKVLQIIANPPSQRAQRPRPPSITPPKPKPSQSRRAKKPAQSSQQPSPSRRHKHQHQHQHHHNRKHHRCRKRHHNHVPKAPPSNLSTRTTVLGAAATQRIEHAARQKRRSEAGVVKKRTSPQRRRPAAAGSESVRGLEVKSRRGSEKAGRKEASDVDGMGRRKSREVKVEKGCEEMRRQQRKRAAQEKGRVDMARIKYLNGYGSLAKAKGFVGRALALGRDGYAKDMLDVVEARMVFKLYVECRERARGVKDPLVEAGRRLQEAKLRKRVVEEEVELKGLEKARAERLGKTEMAVRKKEGRRKRRGVEELVADELGSDLGSLRRLGRSQLEKALFAAAVARLERFERCDNFAGGSGY